MFICVYLFTWNGTHHISGLYSGTILTWPGEDSDGRPTGGPGYDSPNKNHDVNIGDTCSPDAIRR